MSAHAQPARCRHPRDKVTQGTTVWSNCWPAGSYEECECGARRLMKLFPVSKWSSKPRAAGAKEKRA